MTVAPSPAHWPHLTRPRWGSQEENSRPKGGPKAQPRDTRWVELKLKVVGRPKTGRCGKRFRPATRARAQALPPGYSAKCRARGEPVNGGEQGQASKGERVDRPPWSLTGTGHGTTQGPTGMSGSSTAHARATRHGTGRAIGQDVARSVHHHAWHSPLCAQSLV